MTDSRMMQFWEGPGEEGTFAESAPVDGAGKIDNNSYSAYRRWMMRQRMRRAGMNPDQMPQGQMGDMSGMSAQPGAMGPTGTVTPIVWEDTVGGGGGGGGQGGGGQGLSRLFSMFGGGG